MDDLYDFCRVASLCKHGICYLIFCAHFFIWFELTIVVQVITANRRMYFTSLFFDSIMNTISLSISPLHQTCLHRIFSLPQMFLTECNHCWLIVLHLKHLTATVVDGAENFVDLFFVSHSLMSLPVYVCCLSGRIFGTLVHVDPM